MSAMSMISKDSGLSRRGFLRVSATAAGGLIVSLYFDFPLRGQQTAQPKEYPPDAFVHIQRDGKIVIQVNRLEFGQGVQTSLPMVLADEMDADWSQVVAELAPAADVYKDPLFGIQMVGGSGSIAHSFQQYREVAVDCGIAVNPLTVESQFQAGSAFAVQQLMTKGAITFKDGYVQQNNFDGYTPAYIVDAPTAVDVHIVPSTEKPSGCGEPSVPVISPAVVNALFQLTGKRYRRLPLVSL